jgi:hypothetical protein
LGLGVAFGEVGEVELAREAFAAVSNHPHVSDAVRARAQQMSEALGGGGTSAPEPPSLSARPRAI